MFICNKCHERDKNVLNCNDRAHADVNIKGKCDICGKMRKIVWCEEYTGKIKISPKEASYGTIQKSK